MKCACLAEARRWRAPTTGLLASLLLSSCGIFDAGSQVEPPVSAVPVAPVAPIDPNRFTLVDGQDVVGEIQIVAARHEDTFVDIARSYGLGYDELLQANPGVDPWLPGEGTAVVLPTRFVLPQAPRQGIVLNIAAKRLFYFPPAE
jgi:L,D-transpeptidase ErfK/SrfK